MAEPKGREESAGDKMKLDFYADEWEDFVENCGFTDEELEIVSLIRRGWCSFDIAEEVNISLSTFKRRKNKIKNKILRRIEKAH